MSCHGGCVKDTGPEIEMLFHCATIDCGNGVYSLKEELQRQNKLISSERPFKTLQNETKIIKIGHAVLEIFNFKD